jgi:hypothetical protein
MDEASFALDFALRRVQNRIMMSPLLPTPTTGASGHRSNRFAAFGAALLMGCTLAVALSLGASRAAAQVSSTRNACFTVTDPEGRFVAGLDREHFEVSEDGVRREISGFAGADSPITLAIVSEEPLAAAGALGSARELIQTTSIADALQQLGASTSPRKGIAAAAGIDTQAIPPGMPTLQTGAADLPSAVMALRQQYCLDVESSTPSARVEVTVHRIRGLPALQLNRLNGR